MWATRSRSSVRQGAQDQLVTWDAAGPGGRQVRPSAKTEVPCLCDLGLQIAAPHADRRRARETQGLDLVLGRHCGHSKGDRETVLPGDAQDGVTRRLPPASTGRIKDFHRDRLSDHERTIPASVANHQFGDPMARDLKSRLWQVRSLGCFSGTKVSTVPQSGGGRLGQTASRNFDPIEESTRRFGML